MRLAVGNQLTETALTPVDNRACGRVEMYNVAYDVVCFTGLCFCEARLGVLRVREAGSCLHSVLKRHRRTAHGSGSCYESLLHRRRDEHQAADNITSGEN